MASWGDIFVNDAFSAAHRAHVSTEGIAHLLPAYAGRLMEQEIKTLEKSLECPELPMMAIVGGEKIFDIGPETIYHILEIMKRCHTLLWNGPLGVFEVPPFDYGTNAIAQGAARYTAQGNLLSIAGGGDTVAALRHAGVLKDFSYVSTAGGAFLEWVEGKPLPGVKALEQACHSVES